MQEWLPIAAYVLLITVVQLLVYRRLRNRGDTSRRAALRGVRGIDSDPNGDTGDHRGTDAHPSPSRDPTDGEDAHVCPACGARNEPDQTFSRCWNCTTKL